MNLFVSTSGGETSEYMALLLQRRWRNRYAKIVNVFANTGEENPQTLDFVHRCDQVFGLNTVWVEAVVHEDAGVGTTHRVVTYKTASRNGEPFRAMIEKYGIPNSKYPHCTRELKHRPMYSYIRNELGWKPGEYHVAIGIRADEAERADRDAKHLTYPFIDEWPLGKAEVNTFWRDQPFRLELTGYQGNCRACWKKSTRKLLTIMDESPRAFDFTEEMERLFGRVGPEFKKTVSEGYKRVFFRRNMSTLDLRRMHMLDSSWEHAENDAIVYSGKSIPLDQDEGCVESCEVKWSESLE